MNLLISLMLLVFGVFGHLYRFCTDAGPFRRWLAGFGTLLYSLAAVLVLYGNPVGFWIAVVGPLVGFAAVNLFHALGYPVQPDRYQIILGLFQLLTGLLAYMAVMSVPWS